MRYAHAFASLLLLVASGQALPSAGPKGSLSPRGSDSDAKAPSPAIVKAKSPTLGTNHVRLFGANIHQAHERPSTSTQSAHSTRLFGVNIHQPQDRPSTSAHSAHSTRLFGVNIQKSASPAGPKSSHSTHSQAKSGPHLHPKVGSAGLLGQPVAGHQPVRAGSPAKKPKALAADHEHPQVPGSSRAPKRKWWNQAGGKPNVRYGTAVTYWRHREYREKKKLQKQQAHDQHPSADRQHPSSGPGSPGAGGHAVSKRGLCESEY